ncbi:MAG: CTP synthase [Alphaproteobacteria bacterium]|nr:MAG: CTP synthase [Alphaproteobacteria bacterium]
MKNSTPKFIFITGGVVSSLGKGLASASLASLFISRGFKVRLRKLDPYLNVDPGTMSPYQHGECFVTDDGAETDLDLGHYERFTGVNSRKSDNVTTGKIYSQVLKKERRGDYLGATIQVIPHVTDAIKKFIISDISDEDFMFCEIGGTVGDIESLPFIEAIRQLRNELGKENTCFVHVTLLPFINAAKELKTKPTQHSVKELQGMGIQPDILLCRTEMNIPEDQKKKIAQFCNVKEQAVIEAIDVNSIYEVPIAYNNAGFDKEILDYFSLYDKKSPDLSVWKKIISIQKSSEGEVNIGIVGKYTSIIDSYKSLIEAITHGGIANKSKINLVWIDSENIDNVSNCFKDVHGIIVPGGFGERGSDGKILAINYARLNKIPFLGICLGMQLAVIEFARNVMNYKEASSTEFGTTKFPVISLLTEWQTKKGKEKRDILSEYGGTMRLGSYECHLKQNSKIFDIYNNEIIHERHRHRYEVNLDLCDKFDEAGMFFAGMSPDNILPETLELNDHPWFIAVQFHPELKSRPFQPHPLFVSFINASLNQSRLL